MIPGSKVLAAMLAVRFSALAGVRSYRTTPNDLERKLLIEEMVATLQNYTDARGVAVGTVQRQKGSDTRAEPCNLTSLLFLAPRCVPLKGWCRESIGSFASLVIVLLALLAWRCGPGLALRGKACKLPEADNDSSSMMSRLGGTWSYRLLLPARSARTEGEMESGFIIFDAEGLPSITSNDGCLAKRGWEYSLHRGRLRADIDGAGVLDAKVKDGLFSGFYRGERFTMQRSGTVYYDATKYLEGSIYDMWCPLESVVVGRMGFASVSESGIGKIEVKMTDWSDSTLCRITGHKVAATLPHDYSVSITFTPDGSTGIAESSGRRYELWQRDGRRMHAVLRLLTDYGEGNVEETCSQTAPS